MHMNLITKEGRPPVAVSSAETIEGAFRRFLRLDVAAGAPSVDTVRSYLSAAGCWLGWCAGRGLDPRTAGEEDVRTYRRELVERGFARGTIAHRLAVVRRLYDALVWRGLRRSNPAKGIRPPRERHSPEERIRFIDEGKLADLFRGIPTATLKGLRDRSMIALMALHGLRGVEVHRANTGDLDLESDTPKLAVHGKNSDRVVYLRPDVAEALRRYIELRDAARLPRGAQRPLFVALSNRARGERISRRGIRLITDAHLRRVGSVHTGTHLLRHTAATLALAKGAQLTQVQAMLGHRDPKTTTAYAHVVNRIENNPAVLIGVEV